MKTNDLLRGSLLMGIILFAFACKKNNDNDGMPDIKMPVVTTLSRTFVQAGEELTIYGSNLVQPDLLTEVFLSGRPAMILRKSADSITAKVPANTYSGKVMVTISNGTQIVSGDGPQIEVKPTGRIKGFWPIYGYGGDTIELYTENFSSTGTDNAFFIGGLPMLVAGKKGRDTFLVKIPADAVTGRFSFNTYKGPLDTLSDYFLVRKNNYAVNTVEEWLHQDPGFTFMDTLVRGYPVLAGINYESTHKRTYDSVLQYIRYPERKYTIILSNDGGYLNKGISREKFISTILNVPYNYNTLLISAVIPGYNIHLNEVQDGDTYNTAYSMKLAFYPYPVESEDVNQIRISTIEGNRYVEIFGPYESRPPVKIVHEHQIGNATIIETEGELGYIYF